TISAVPSTRSFSRARSMAGSYRALARLSLSMRSMIQTADNSFQARSWTTLCRAPAIFRPSLSQLITCLRRPTHWASRARVRLAPSARRRRLSTRSSTLSIVVLNCATSICQRRRAVYGKCSTEYTRGTLYNIACAGESVGNDRLTLLAQFEGDDERWSAKLHASQDYRDSAREAAPNMFDWCGPLGKSEWPSGGRKEAHGSHPREGGVEGTARETHAGGATAVHRCRLGARTRPGSGGGAPN